MKVNLYMILDEKARAFSALHSFRSHGDAIRAFGDSVRNPKTSLNLHPEDYSFYFVGVLDDQDASIDRVVPIQLLAHAREFMTSVSQPVEAIQ